MTNKMTIAERTHIDWHRSHIIIRELDAQWYLAEFDSVAQLDFFAQTLGISYEQTGSRETKDCGFVREYRLSHKLTTPIDGYFWNKEDLPAGARPIKALSNGSIVTCYFLNDGDTVTIYRPNPNAADVYDPMNISQHVAHCQVYGSY